MKLKYNFPYRFTCHAISCLSFYHHNHIIFSILNLLLFYPIWQIINSTKFYSTNRKKSLYFFFCYPLFLFFGSQFLPCIYREKNRYYLLQSFENILKSLSYKFLIYLHEKSGFYSFNLHLFNTFKRNILRFLFL